MTVKHAGATLCTSLLLVAIGGGCDSAAETPLSFYREYVRSSCAYAVRCGLIGASERGRCEAQVVTALDLKGGAAISDDCVKQHRCNWDRNAAQRCLDALHDVTCRTLSAATSHCQRVLTGTIAAGGRCNAIAADCADGLCVFDSKIPANCGGTCVSYAAIGQPCSSSPIGCGPNRACDSKSATCVALPAAGARCSPGHDCDSSSVCLDSVCVARWSAPAGAPCSEQASFACAGGTFCDFITNPAHPVCTSLRDAGQACVTREACKDGLACSGYDAVSPGTCVAFVDEGDTCDPTMARCPQDMDCDIKTRRCHNLQTASEGSPCVNATCNSFGNIIDPSLYCAQDMMTCRQLGGTGASCTSDTQCASRTCDMAMKTCQPSCL